MGLFDSLKDAAEGALAGGAGGAAGGEGVVGKLLGMGGAELPGLLDKLHVGGLGDIAKSWVAKGENKPITPDQVKKTLPEQVAGVAKQLNLSLDDAAALIAKYLPDHHRQGDPRRPGAPSGGAGQEGHRPAEVVDGATLFEAKPDGSGRGRPRPMKPPLLIVNPACGAQSARTLPQVLAAVEKTMGDVVIRYTARRGHASELAEQGAKEGYELIVAVGGDGTLSEVVNGVLTACDAGEAASGAAPAGGAPEGARPTALRSACRR